MKVRSLCFSAVVLLLAGQSASAAPLTLTGIRLPDSHMTLKGRRVSLMNQTVSIRVPEVRIETAANQMDAAIDLYDIVVNIPVIRIQKKQTVYCYNSQVRIGPKAPIPFRATVPVGVEEGAVAIGKVAVDFRIPANNFGSSGPSSCKGKIFNKPLIRWFVERSLQNSRPQVEATILKAVRDLLPGRRWERMEFASNQD